ncbi:MAG: HAMP domain-containing histidine kinase [Bacteroidetes bacterium]|nr:HAMP domain-containing histidine kinase [Bacteroidota bacterium]
MKLLHPVGKIWKRTLTKWQIKALLSFFAFAMVVGVLLYTRLIVKELSEREKRTVEFYAAIYSRFVSNPNANADDLLYTIEKINSTISFPTIFTDGQNIPNVPYSDYSQNISLDTSLSPHDQKIFMDKMVQEMGSLYPPIDIKNEEGVLIQRIYYSNSTLLRQIQLLPYVEIIIVSAFIFIGYIAFSYLRRTEESNVWVGMAKEAAHQLGTPLSSLLAWIEILKINSDEPALVGETIQEMEHDIARLNIIANRFSTIGSLPKKKTENLAKIVEKVCVYYQRRVPHLGKKIDINCQLDDTITAQINVDLFEWVIENLLKNGVEAIESQNGSVNVKLFWNARGKIMLTIRDTGKGMNSHIRRQVFLPGYTTKKRGWGLGLSLSKRIIEKYHNGKIYVKNSAPNKGTTFAIELPQSEIG